MAKRLLSVVSSENQGNSSPQRVQIDIGNRTNSERKRPAAEDGRGENVAKHAKTQANHDVHSHENDVEEKLNHVNDIAGPSNPVAQQDDPAETLTQNSPFDKGCIIKLESNRGLLKTDKVCFSHFWQLNLHN